MLIDIKLQLLKKHRNELVSMLEMAEKSILEAQIEANYHIGAMQSRYDTFKEEAQYLVDAQKIRRAELMLLIENYSNLIEKIVKMTFSSIRIGACFVISNEITEMSFFVVPSGLGGKIQFNNREYICVSENAPLIKPFIEKKIDDYADEVIHKLDDFVVVAIL
jgi:hypothetical protein